MLEFHVLTVNLPNEEVDFPVAEVRKFTDPSAIKDYADIHHPGWTSMVVVVLPEKAV